MQKMIYNPKINSREQTSIGAAISKGIVVSGRVGHLRWRGSFQRHIGLVFKARNAGRRLQERRIVVFEEHLRLARVTPNAETSQIEGKRVTRVLEGVLRAVILPSFPAADVQTLFVKAEPEIRSLIRAQRAGGRPVLNSNDLLFVRVADDDDVRASRSRRRPGSVAGHLGGGESVTAREEEETVRWKPSSRTENS